MDKEYIVIGKVIGKTKRGGKVFKESKGGGGKGGGGKGEGRYVLKFYVDSVEEIKKFKRYFIDDGYGNKEELDIRVKVLGKKVYGDIVNYGVEGKSGEGFNGKELYGKELYINRSELPELEGKGGEYYQIDLRGSECILESGQRYGEVEEVVNYGAGDLLKIRQAVEEGEESGKGKKGEKGEKGKKRGGGQIKYVPFRKELIKGVEVSKKLVYLKDIEGYD